MKSSKFWRHLFADGSPWWYDKLLTLAALLPWGLAHIAKCLSWTHGPARGHCLCRGENAGMFLSILCPTTSNDHWRGFIGLLHRSGYQWQFVAMPTVWQQSAVKWASTAEGEGTSLLSFCWLQTVSLWSDHKSDQDGICPDNINT